MEVNYALEPGEVEQGFVLACQTKPKAGSTPFCVGLRPAVKRSDQARSSSSIQRSVLASMSSVTSPKRVASRLSSSCPSGERPCRLRVQTCRLPSGDHLLKAVVLPLFIVAQPLGCNLPWGRGAFSADCLAASSWLARPSVWLRPFLSSSAGAVLRVVAGKVPHTSLPSNTKTWSTSLSMK